MIKKEHFEQLNQTQIPNFNGDGKNKRENTNKE